MSQPGILGYDALLAEAMKSLVVDSGTVSVAAPVGAIVLQDDTKNWSANSLRGCLVRIARGSGVGQLRAILSNTDRLLTLDQGWTTSLGRTSMYVIIGGARAQDLTTLRQIIRDVLGGGADISGANPLPVDAGLSAEFWKYIPLAQNLNNFRFYGNPILSPGAAGQWDAGDIHTPKIYYHRGWSPRWRIYYAAPRPGVTGFRIGFAQVATPTATWAKSVANPIIVPTEAWEVSGVPTVDAVSALCIVFLGANNLVGYYQYRSSADGKYRTASVVSTDGITWTGKTQVSIADPPGTTGLEPTIMDAFYEPSERKYYAVAHVFDRPNNEYYGRVYESSDGLTFTPKSRLLLSFSAYGKGYVNWRNFDPHCLTKFGGLYIILFQTNFEAVLAGDPTTDMHMGLAISKDLAVWHVFPRLLISPQGFDQYRAGNYPHCFIAWGGKIYGVCTITPDVDLLYKVGLWEIELTPPYTTTMLSVASLAASGNVNSKAIQPGSESLALTIEETYHALATAGGRLRLYTSYDGTNYDSIPVLTQNLSFTAGATIRETIYPNPATRFMRANVENLDGVRAITNLKIVATTGGAL